MCKMAIAGRQQNPGNFCIGLPDQASFEKVRRFLVPAQLKICLRQPMQSNVRVMRIKAHAAINPFDGFLRRCGALSDGCEILRTFNLFDDQRGKNRLFFL